MHLGQPSGLFTSGLPTKTLHASFPQISQPKPYKHLSIRSPNQNPTSIFPSDLPTKILQAPFPQISPPKPYTHLSLRSPHQNPIRTFPTTYRPFHSSWFDHPINVWWAVNIIKNSSLLSLTSSLGPNIFLSTLFSNTLNTLFSNTLNLCSFLNLREPTNQSKSGATWNVS